MLLVDLLGRYSNQPWVRERISRLLALPEANALEGARAPHRRLQRLTAQDQGVLVERYRGGESVYDLASAFQITRQTVSALLERNGVARRYRLFDEDAVDEARRLYAEGLSLAAVAARTGVSTRTVANAFRSAGVETRRVGTNQWS